MVGPRSKELDPELSQVGKFHYGVGRAGDGKLVGVVEYNGTIGGARGAIEDGQTRMWTVAATRRRVMVDSFMLVMLAFIGLHRGKKVNVVHCGDE